MLIGDSTDLILSRLVGGSCLRPDNHLDAELRCLSVRLAHSVDPDPIRPSDAVEPEPLALIDKFLGMRRAFEEGEMAFTPERGVGHGSERERAAYIEHPTSKFGKKKRDRSR